MKSDDYKSLLYNLHNLKKKIEHIEVTLGKNEYATITFNDASVIQTTENDTITYITQLKRVLDKDGDFVFRRVKDTEKYINDEVMLYRDHDAKVRDADEELKSGTFSFAYNVDTLQEEFIVSKNRSQSKFEPLKQDYFHIAAYRVSEAGAAIALHENNKQRLSGYEKYYDKIVGILTQAFMADENFIKNYSKRSEKANFKLLDAIGNYITSLENMTSMGSLITPSGVAMDAGIRVVLDTYVKYVEASYEPINLLRIAFELNSGVDNPEPQKSGPENKQILDSLLHDELASYEPHLRNADAHLSYKIDMSTKKVNVTDRGGYSASYGFNEIIDMANTITHNLLPALVGAIVMQYETTILYLSTQSHEYIAALLSIDNLLDTY